MASDNRSAHLDGDNSCVSITDTPTMDITGAVTMEACIEWDDFLEGTPLADANYDGEVTVADYEVWKSHFAIAVSAVSSSIASKVPTPSANLLLLALMPLFGRLYVSNR